MTKKYEFLRRFPGGGTYVLGRAFHTHSGWQFYPDPQIPNRRPSRVHSTMEKCLPKWLGYPDGCESRLVNDDPRVKELLTSYLESRLYDPR